MTSEIDIEKAAKYSAPEFNCTPRVMASIIRSRPHTPAPSQVLSELKAYTEGRNSMLNEILSMSIGDQHSYLGREAARAATLAENKRVLDAIQKFKTEAWERHEPCDGGFTKFYQSLRVTEESLRTAAQEAQK